MQMGRSLCPVLWLVAPCISLSDSWASLQSTGFSFARVGPCQSSGKLTHLRIHTRSSDNQVQHSFDFEQRFVHLLGQQWHLHLCHQCSPVLSMLHHPLSCNWLWSRRPSTLCRISAYRQMRPLQSSWHLHCVQAIASQFRLLKQLHGPKLSLQPRH